MSKKPSSTDILQRFKKVVIQFIDDLIDLFPQEKDLIILRVFFDNQVPVATIVEGFIIHVIKHKNTIKARDEKFFIENNNIFGLLDSDKVLHFKKLWISPVLDSEDRAMIWKYFDAFITLVEAYRSSI